jgi:creatinine amidohydrolase
MNNHHPEVRLERMTWQEIEAALAAGKTTAIIVAGSSEQHGPHLPEGTDAMIVEGLGVRLAWKLGNALVAPVIRPGCSDHHLAFPGTVSISADLLQGIIDAYISSLRRHGFKHFFIFSSHGGNFPVLIEMVKRGLPSDVFVVSDLIDFANVMLDSLRRFGRNDRTIPHADASETGEMLVLHPDLVHMDRAERGYVGDVDPDKLMREGLKSLTKNGVLGDPVGATEEMGEEVLTSLVDFLSEQASALGTA